MSAAEVPSAANPSSTPHTRSPAIFDKCYFRAAKAVVVDAIVPDSCWARDGNPVPTVKQGPFLFTFAEANRGLDFLQHQKPDPDKHLYAMLLRVR